MALTAYLLPLASCLFAQGSLTPPGPPAPTFKTLEQVEPRTPITNLPLTISVPGSYYLVTNLTGTASGGITISANDVTLDLMGFVLAGGTGNGILVLGSRTNIAIRNGTVRSWTGAAVGTSSANTGQYQDLRLSANGSGGLAVGINSAVNKCVAQSNTGTGIVASAGSAISGCAARGNTRTGIFAGDGSTVSGCLATTNTLGGINVGSGSTVSGCTASFNTGDGIEFESSCRVAENSCTGNGAGAGDGAGINATSSRNRIDSNTVMGNDRGIDCNPATANLIIRNSARGNTVNYDIVTGNTLGPTNNLVNATTGIITNAHPWANFEF